MSQLLDGLSMGATYALLAIAFTLVFGVLRHINLAYGASIMLGIYAAIWASNRWHLEPLLLMPIVIGVTVVAGVYVDRLCFVPHRGRARATATAMAASFAVWMQLEELSTMLVPSHANAFPSPFAPVSNTTAGRTLRPIHAAALGCAAFASFGIWYLLYRTRFGIAVRATRDEREAAGYAGIHVKRVSASITLIASVIGGLAGYLIMCIHTQVTPMFAMWVTLKGLVAAMLGGIGSLLGALLGGLVLGLVESFAHPLVGPQCRDLLSYVLLLFVLWRCPAGLSWLWRGDAVRAVEERS